MNYVHAINCIREETGYDGWVEVDATKPPSEEEKTSLSVLLNPQLLQELKENVTKAVDVYFSRKKFDFKIGLPVGALQIVYQEIFGCPLDYEVLGFHSLVKFCLYTDGDGFHMCKINDNYVLLPVLSSWYLPEAEPDIPMPPEIELLEYPKDMADFNYVLQELDHKQYLKPGEKIKIVIVNYEDPLTFNFIPEPFFWTFVQFRKGLTDFYRNNNDLRMPREFIRPGQICAVGYLTSLRFVCIYDRGLIIDIFNETTVTVLLVDIGKKILAPMTIVKFLHKQFASFPVHGLPGTLAGLLPRTAVLTETGKTRMNMHLKEPYLEGELYCPNYEEPMFPMVLFSRYSRKSLNRQLTESRDFRYTPYFPSNMVTRGLNMVETKYEYDMYGDAGNENLRSQEREVLVELDSEGEADDDDTESEEIERVESTRRDPWTRLPEPKRRIRPSPSIIRPRPIVDVTISSLALGPISAPPNVKSDARQSKNLKPIRLPLQVEALALKRKKNKNEIVEKKIKPRPVSQDDLFKLRMMNIIQPSIMNFQRQFSLPTIYQDEVSPRDLVRERMPLIVYDNSSTDSDEFEDPEEDEPSNSNERRVPNTAPWLGRGNNGRDTHPNQNSANSEEDDLNVDRNKLFPPERCTFFDVPKARAEVSSDSTESDSEPEDYTKDSIEELKDDLEKLQEEMEMNRLTVSLLATNQIVRDVARQRPQRAYPLAKEWAKFILETNDSSLPDGSLFNPFDKLREDLDEKLELKYQLLAQMVPGFIHDEYVALAAAAPMGNPSINMYPRDNWQGFLWPISSADDIKNEEIQATSAVGKDFRPTWETILVEVTSSTKKRRYKLTTYNMEIYVSKDELRMLSVFPELKIIERLKYYRRTVINWRVDTPRDRVEFRRFLRFFNGFITLHTRIDRYERDAKKKILFPRGTR